MTLPKTLDRIEEKLDRILALLEQPPAEPDSNEPTTLDPAAVAQLLDYDSYTAKEIIERVSSLPLEQRAALLIYEQQNAARKTVLEALG